MNYRGSVLCVLLAVGSAVASAQQYLTEYDVTLDIGKPVTNIMMFEQTAGYSSTTWAFQADGSATTNLLNPFPQDLPVESSLLIGLVQGLDTDASADQKHVVLMMDPTAASLSEHIAWGTLFRNTDEDQLIADIELATSGEDFDVIQPGLDAVENFAYNDAQDGILGPGGVPYTAWFETGGDFSVLSFSDGQQIGSGHSFLTPVPEPASFAVVGIGLAAFLRKRKSKASTKL